MTSSITQQDVRVCSRCRGAFDISSVPADFQPLCPHCLTVGTATLPANIPDSPLRQTQSSAAIFALVLGVISLIPILSPLSIVALIIGVLARAKMKRDPTLYGDGLALTAIIMASVGLLVFIFFVGIILLSILIPLIDRMGH